MPPPNVTGSLHMGHAMFVTLEVEEVVAVLVFPISFYMGLAMNEPYIF